MFSYFTEFDAEIPPDGMMCTNVSMWSAVYWTPENVSECASEIKTKKEEDIKEVFIQSIPKQNTLCPTDIGPTSRPNIFN